MKRTIIKRKGSYYRRIKGRRKRVKPHKQRYYRRIFTITKRLPKGWEWVPPLEKGVLYKPEKPWKKQKVKTLSSFWKGDEDYPSTRKEAQQEIRNLLSKREEISEELEDVFDPNLLDPSGILNREKRSSDAQKYIESIEEREAYPGQLTEGIRRTNVIDKEINRLIKKFNLKEIPKKGKTFASLTKRPTKIGSFWHNRHLHGPRQKQMKDFKGKVYIVSQKWAKERKLKVPRSIPPKIQKFAKKEGLKLPERYKKEIRLKVGTLKKKNKLGVQSYITKLRK